MRHPADVLYPAARGRAERLFSLAHRERHALLDATEHVEDLPALTGSGAHENSVVVRIDEVKVNGAKDAVVGVLRNHLVKMQVVSGWWMIDDVIVLEVTLRMRQRESRGWFSDKSSFRLICWPCKFL